MLVSRMLNLYYACVPSLFENPVTSGRRMVTLDRPLQIRYVCKRYFPLNTGPQASNSASLHPR
jgi:hypothetical protein